MSNIKPITDWGNTLYKDAGDLGVFKADLIMIIAFIIASVMIVIGFVMVINGDDQEYIRIKGTVVEPNCTKSSTTYDDKGRMNESYKCNMLVAYSIEKKNLQNRIYVTGNEIYIKGEPIDLVIMKSNHNNVQLSYIDNVSYGSILIGSSVAIFAMAYLNYYLTRNYNLFAAAQGTSAIVSLFR
jgi:hypothetical protein